MFKKYNHKTFFGTVQSLYESFQLIPKDILLLWRHRMRSMYPPQLRWNTFEVLLDLLMHTKSLSDYLHKKKLDLCQLQIWLHHFRCSRKSILKDHYYDEHFIKAEAKCTELEIDEPLLLPKRRRVSTSIDETPGNQFHHQSAKDYYRVEFYFGTLDVMLNGLKNCFSPASCEILRAFAPLHPSKLSTDNTTGIKILGDFYKNDLDQI